MEVTGAGTTTQSASSSAGASLAADFDTFLTLLTTQLKFQDPLDPLDSNQFTDQLVSFAGVEQQIAANTNLETLIARMTTQDIAASVGYLGREVTIASNQSALLDGEAKWSYSLDANAADVKLTVKDVSGNTVYTENGLTTAGLHEFNWDGININGTPQNSGLYFLTVDAKSAAGNTVSSQTYQKGIVSAIDTSEGQSLLSVNGLLVPREAIASVSLPQTETTDE